MDNKKIARQMGLGKNVPFEYKAEYTPWARIFKRIEDICDKTVELSVLVRNGHYELIRPFFEILQELYDNLMPILTEPIRKSLEKEFDELRNKIEGWEKQTEIVGMFKPNFLSDLQELKRKLFKIKQMVGLGIPVTIEKSIKEKLEMVLNVREG